MARSKTKVNKNHQRSIVSRYNKGTGLVELAEQFELGIQIIRRVLTDNEVAIRGRGRPVLTA